RADAHGDALAADACAERGALSGAALGAAHRRGDAWHIGIPRRADRPVEGRKSIVLTRMCLPIIVSLCYSAGMTNKEEREMADFDIHIKGGTVVDGTRAPRFRADVWVKDGKVAQIGGRAPGFAKKVIDADGLIVAPGFVDLHTHYDAQI